MRSINKHQFTFNGNQVELVDKMSIPQLKNNLLSINTEVSKGTKLTNEGETSVLIYTYERKMRFDYQMNTPKRFLLGEVLSPLGADATQEECDLKEMKTDFPHQTETHQDVNIDKAKTEHLG